MTQNMYQILLWNAKSQQWESDWIGENAPRPEDECRADVCGLNGVGFDLQPDMENQQPERCWDSACEICDNREHLLGWKIAAI